MKGILLALASFGFLTAASVVAVRLYPGKKYFKPLIGAFLLAVSAYTLLFAVLPGSSNLDPALDFGNGLFILFLLFNGFWDGIYTSFLTGFSTGILIRFLQKGRPGLTEGEVLRMYQTDPSNNPVMDLRLKNLMEGRYLAAAGEGCYRLRLKGNFFAGLTQTLQSLFHMGAGG